MSAWRYSCFDQNLERVGIRRVCKCLIRFQDLGQFESVGVKEGIGTNVELFYSWMDQTPPAGFAYYRVKKITRDGTQFYSATNTVINQGSSFNPKTNYAQGKPE